MLSLKPQGGNLLWTQRITEGMPYLTLWGSPNGVRPTRSMLLHSGEADKGATGSGMCTDIGKGFCRACSMVGVNSLTMTFLIWPLIHNKAIKILTITT